MEGSTTESFDRFVCIILQDLHQINAPYQSFTIIQIDLYDVNYLRYVLFIVFSISLTIITAFPFTMRHAA